jgi:hypothetical protein
LKQLADSVNNLVYRPLDGEKAEKTMIPPSEYDIDSIVASIEAVGEKSTDNKKKKNKKKK